VNPRRIGTTTLLAALCLTVPAWAQQAGPPYGPDMMWPGGWYGMMFLGPVMMLLFIAAAAHRAAQRYGATGRRVHLIEFPQGMDANDMLRREAAAA